MLTQEFFLENSIPVPESGCWLWTRGTSSNGYGYWKVNGKSMVVHRLAYAAFRGPIPDEIQTCHKCDVRSCINPDHIFLGTQKDNIQDCVAKNRQWQVRKTHCQRGHAYTDENTRPMAGRPGRLCKTCVRINGRASYARHRQARVEYARRRRARGKA